MSLESLANELLLDLFEYLSDFHRLRAFYGLNSRFQNLLLVHFRFYHLDFRSVSKYAFDNTCQQHFPSIVDRVISLCLSDDDETPEQTATFLSYDFPLPQLTSLSLFHLSSDQIISQFILELPNLTHLNIAQCYLSCDQTAIDCIVNRIWNLRKLINCHLDLTFKMRYDTFLHPPTIIAICLENVLIDRGHFDLSQLASFIKYTPCLRHLNINIRDYSIDYCLPFVVSQMITLKIYFQGSLHAIRNVFQNMPNLCHLTVETQDIHLNGYQWKSIIVEHLPKLKVFRFKMEYNLISNNYKEVQINHLLDSFRSPFWFEEHQWFVKCHGCPHGSSKLIYLYTPPYTFTDFRGINGIRFKSAHSQENGIWSYNRVDCIGENLVLSQSHFSSIKRLSLEIPFNDTLLCVGRPLDRITSLEISWNDQCESGQSRLQAILDRAPRLNSLRFVYWPSLDVSVINMTSRSVRRLDFQASGQWFNSDTCALLSHSPLAIQCEMLRIEVETRTDILDLINSMVNLRALNVRCQDDRWKFKEVPEEDEFVEWLRYRLPTACNIVRDTRYDQNVRLWIR